MSLKEIFTIYWEGVCRIKALAAGFSRIEAVGVGGGAEGRGAASPEMNEQVTIA